MQTELLPGDVSTVVFCLLEHHREKSTSSTQSDFESDHVAALDLRAAGLAGVVKTVKSLFTNGAYVFTVLYITCIMIIINALGVFGAKYFQQQFGLTAAMAGVAFG